MSKRHTFTIDYDLAHLVHQLADSAIKAKHNHIVHAVEREDFAEAKKMADEVKRLRVVFATFNVEVKAQTKPGCTEHQQHAPL